MKCVFCKTNIIEIILCGKKTLYNGIVINMQSEDLEFYVCDNCLEKQAKEQLIQYISRN